MSACHQRKTGRGTYSLGVELCETVRLVRDPTIMCIGITWRSAGRLGTSSNSDIEGRIRNVVDAELDGFLNDYLAANPKQPAVRPTTQPAGKK